MSGPAFELLAGWTKHAEKYWYDIPGQNGLGCYGSGYNSWGVQTNQKFLSAMAVLATGPELISEEVRVTAQDRARAALRFSLYSHVSGPGQCTDGTKWGRTWISGLGIERMMHGVYLLEESLEDRDREAIRDMLTAESDWLLKEYEVTGDPDGHSGKNHPESNLWNGALMWRTAVTYPHHPHAGEWKEKAARFLINSVSVAGDADNTKVVDGKPVKERFVGANFFPNYALDHHAYFNVGYIFICISNAAILHFDLKKRGLPVPESLYHHQSDLWQVARRFIFSDGRLARLGGDSRIRYAYCQEYLLPSLLLAADKHDDDPARFLVDQQLRLIRREAVFNGDGSFYGKRLLLLADSSPYYYTRLESDRACALGMLVQYLKQLPETAEFDAGNGHVQRQEAFEASVSGQWCDPDHGAVMHRSVSRLASFSWRAHDSGQGLCLPPDNGHLAEWQQNLAGYVRFQSDNQVGPGGDRREREVEKYSIHVFEGGFITSGGITEGLNTMILEGWRGKGQALHQLVICALPDGHTMLGLQFCRTHDLRTYVAEIKGMHLNIPNDFYNGFERKIMTGAGVRTLRSPAGEEGIMELHGPWANLEGVLGMVGLYGADQLVISRSGKRRGGRFGSLFVEEVCIPCEREVRAVDPGTVVLDAGWAVLSDADAETTRHFSGEVSSITSEECIRAVMVKGLDDSRYAVLVNFDEKVAAYPTAPVFGGAGKVIDLVTGDRMAGKDEAIVTLKPGEARVFKIE